MNIILLGAPGAGKGTQAENISNYLKIPAISTGNIIREALRNGTEAGLKAKSFMDEGKLVPDSIVIEMLKERLSKDDCSSGYILDGFPRNVPQAEELDKMGVVIDKVIEIFVPDEKITERMSGRRVCEICGASYHIAYKLPKNGNACDIDGGKLIQRNDDKPETVLARLAVYHEQTEPLKDYYALQNKLSVVEGQEKVEDTTALTLKLLKG